MSEHEVTEGSPAHPSTLSDFYADPRNKASSFIKTVRSAKVKAFATEDAEHAQTMLAEKDPDLARTLGLALGDKIPDVIERWVGDATRVVVHKLDPTIAEESSAEFILERVVRASAEKLQSKDQSIRTRAQNVVRLSLIWLTRARSLDPLRALQILSDTHAKPGASGAIRSRAQRMLVQAKPGQWRILALIVQLSSDAVQRSDRAAMDATRARERLEIHVAELGTVVATQRQEADNLSLEINSLRADLDAKTNALEAERKLRNLDLAHAAGRTRSLLTGRFSLLLSDARDALSFEPPHVEAAKQRLDALRATIDQEVANSDE